MTPNRRTFPTAAPPAQDGKPPGRVQSLVLRLLNKHNLSQGEIKRRTGFDQSRLSRYSRGMVPDSLEEIFKLIDLDAELAAAAKVAANDSKEEAPAATPAPAG